MAEQVLKIISRCTSDTVPLVLKQNISKALLMCSRRRTFAKLKAILWFYKEWFSINSDEAISLNFTNCFSNSLIIHQVKTKEHTTVNPVLISIDFDDFTSPLIPWFLFQLRRYIKHSRQCFIGHPNTSNSVKNTPLRVVFSTLFLVFGYPDETLSLVFDILRKKKKHAIDDASIH